MPEIIIKREEEIFNRFRRYKVFLNDDLSGVMFFGDTIRRIVPEGENTIQVRMEWCGSQIKPFLMRENQIKVFVIKPVDTPRIINSMIVFLLIIFFLYPPSFLDVPWIFNFVLILSSILLLIYNLTLGRDDFLEIEEHFNDPEVEKYENSIPL